MDGREMRSRGHNGERLLRVCSLAALAWLMTVLCADTLHLWTWDEQRVVVVRGRDTFAARQTVHALAPLTTGCLFLQHKRR